MPGFDALFLTQFALSAASSLHQNQVDQQQRLTQIHNANAQASINNNLNYNAHLNLNAQQLLEFKKFGLDDFELKKSIRRERASRSAMAASFGNSFGQQGATADATQRNIERHGLNALVRKDLNYKTKLQDFSIRHKNIDLTTLSQNNQAFSNISSGPSNIGTALEIAGTGLQIFENSRKGTLKDG
jgi:hypothetical protein